jgi:hypothetical protein
MRRGVVAVNVVSLLAVFVSIAVVAGLLGAGLVIPGVAALGATVRLPLPTAVRPGG